MSSVKPVFLADLDDTLFQTKRKMVGLLAAEPVRVGALDRNLSPLSFMSQEQSMMVDFLIAHTDLIPVTARSTDEFARVQLPFKSYAITTHGAVLLRQDGSVDTEWQSQMMEQLERYQARLAALQARADYLIEGAGFDAFTRMMREYDGTLIYLNIKHRDKTKVNEIYNIGSILRDEFAEDGFYIHQNSNNVAILPACVEKGQAAEFLLRRLREERGVFPTLGLGDSLTDFSFMRLCSWFGMPRQSQFATAISPVVEAPHGH